MTASAEQVRAKSVPAAAVRRIGQTFLGLISGRKGYVGGRVHFGMKAPGSTREQSRLGLDSSTGKERRMVRGAVKCLDPNWNFKCEGTFLDRNADAKVRKRG